MKTDETITPEQCQNCNSWSCHFHPNNNFWKENPLVFSGICRHQKIQKQRVLELTWMDCPHLMIVENVWLECTEGDHLDSIVTMWCEINRGDKDCPRGFR